MRSCVSHAGHPVSLNPVVPRTAPVPGQARAVLQADARLPRLLPGRDAQSGNDGAGQVNRLRSKCYPSWQGDARRDGYLQTPCRPDAQGGVDLGIDRRGKQYGSDVVPPSYKPTLTDVGIEKHTQTERRSGRRYGCRRRRWAESRHGGTDERPRFFRRSHCGRA